MNKNNLINKQFIKVYMMLSEKRQVAIRRYIDNIIKIKGKIKFPIVMFLFSNKKIDDICDFEQTIYSQNGEDGILKMIFSKIGTTNKYCVEFGAGNGWWFSNVYYFITKGWDSLQMDKGWVHSPLLKIKKRRNIKADVKNEFVTPENIEILFKKYNVPNEFDLLSIDIDSYDYWVWKAIKNYSPRVIVIEYNVKIPITESKTMKYDSEHCNKSSDYFGASLLALYNLGKEKGYTLLGCESKGANAFFLRNDVIKDCFEIKTVEEIYKPFQHKETTKCTISEKYVNV